MALGLENEPELDAYCTALDRWAQHANMYSPSANETSRLLAIAVKTRYVEALDAGIEDESLVRLAKAHG